MKDGGGIGLPEPVPEDLCKSNAFKGDNGVHGRFGAAGLSHIEIPYWQNQTKPCKTGRFCPL
jgi:hypothetical protein